MTITRRATLAALTASPFTIASVATQAAPGGEGQTHVARLFVKWKSEVREGNRLSYLDREEESGRAYDSALNIQDEIAAAPCQNSSDVWIKLHVALDNFPDAPDDNILLSLKVDATRLVNTTDFS